MSKDTLFDPSKDSRGIWYLIHRQAILATTDSKKAEFINYMTFLSKEFPCEKCRTHILAFIAENPFYLYMNVSYTSYSDVGMFKFSWALHNAVNFRLGKKLIDFGTAYNLYKDQSVCTNGCSESESKTPETPKSAPVILESSRNELSRTEPIKNTLRLTSSNYKKR
jgi:hypothetical protein